MVKFSKIIGYVAVPCVPLFFHAVTVAFLLGFTVMNCGGACLAVRCMMEEPRRFGVP
jgi:hypothetical protein